MIEGTAEIEVAASVATCFAAAGQFDRAPEWQSFVRSSEVLERDEEGRPLVAETVADARIREVRYRLRYGYDPPREITWTQLDGDLRHIEGFYRFHALGEERTRIEYRLAIDPGRRLGLVLRGPIVGRVRDAALAGTLRELKAAIEGGKLD